MRPRLLPSVVSVTLLAFLLTGCGLINRAYESRAVAQKAISGAMPTTPAAGTAPVVPQPGPVVLNPSDNNPFRIEVRTGWDHWIREGASTPVIVDLENTGPDFEGSLDITSYLDETYGVQYRRPIALPRETKKRVVTFLTNLQGRPFEVTLSSGDRTAASVSVPVFSRYGFVIGVLSSSEDTLRHLNGSALGSQASASNGRTLQGPPAPGMPGRPISVAGLTPELVPDSSTDLNALDMIALSDFSSSWLTPKQWEAISEWVDGGGILVFSGGANGQKTLGPVPGDLLPVELTGSRTASGMAELARLGGEDRFTDQAVVSVGRRIRGDVLASDAGTPLLIEERRGRGNVYYLALDLGMEPLANWRGNQAFWKAILTRTGAAANQVYYSHNPNPLAWSMRNLPGLQLPPSKTIGLILLGYIVLIGPLNFFILKRLRRPDWAWGTIPLTVLILVAGFFTVGYTSTGKYRISNSVGVLNLEPGAPKAKLEAAFGVFAPTREQLRFEIPADSEVSPTPFRLGPEFDQSIAVRLIEGAPRLVELTEANLWTVRSFAVSQTITSPGFLDADLRVEGTDLTGEVINRTPYQIKDAVIAIGSNFARLGDLEPGAKAPLTIKTGVQPGGGPVNWNLPHLLYNPAATAPPSAPHVPPKPIPPENMRKIQLLENLFQPSKFGNSGLTPMVFGWTEEPIGLETLSLPGGLNHRLFLVTSPLVPKLDGPSFTLLPGLISGKLIASDLRRGGPNSGGWFLANGSSVTFDLTAPVPEGAVITNAAVNFSVLNTPNPIGMANLPVTTELYNWAKERWEELPVDFSHNRVAIPDSRLKEFLDPNRTVRIKVGVSEREINFSVPTLSLEGRSGR